MDTEARKDKTSVDPSIGTGLHPVRPTSVDLGNACPGSRVGISQTTTKKEFVVRFINLVHRMEACWEVPGVSLSSGHHNKVPQYLSMAEVCLLCPHMAVSLRVLTPRAPASSSYMDIGSSGLGSHPYDLIDFHHLLKGHITLAVRVSTYGFGAIHVIP